MYALSQKSKRQILTDPTCRLSAVYQGEDYYRSPKKVLKGYLLSEDGSVDPRLITPRSKEDLESEDIEVFTTEPAPGDWIFSNQAKGNASIGAKITSLFSTWFGGGNSMGYVLVAKGVKEIVFKDTLFLDSVKPEFPTAPSMGINQDKKGRVILFVLVKLLVADTVYRVTKGETHGSGQLSLMGEAGFEALVQHGYSCEEHVSGGEGNPVILQRTFRRMAWGKDKRPLAKLHGKEETDDVTITSKALEDDDDSDPDEDAFIDVEEEGFWTSSEIAT